METANKRFRFQAQNEKRSAMLTFFLRNYKETKALPGLQPIKATTLMIQSAIASGMLIKKREANQNWCDYARENWIKHFRRLIVPSTLALRHISELKVKHQLRQLFHLITLNVSTSRPRRHAVKAISFFPTRSIR